MIDTSALSEIEDALRERRLDVERVEDTFNVSQGSGIMAHKAHIDPRPLLEQLSDAAPARRRQIAGYASGIKHVLLEPKRSSAGEWDFVESAGGLIPGIHVSTFTTGVDAASGSPAWTLDFEEDLQIAYIIKLDRGLRVLTTAQVDRWGVSADRITSASRSLLFHKTRNLNFEPFAAFDDVRRLQAGDGHDAARCLVVGDAFYSDIDDAFRFALPSPDHFLCVFDSTPTALKQLKRATTEVYNDVDYPLSKRLFRFETGTPVPLDEAPHDR